MSGVPYIGAKISLISRSEIRYEGILAEVDPKESTIGLENVLMMGTENRKPPHEFVPMSEQVFDFILFRSTDIKDLQVCEAPRVPQPNNLHYMDPAIVSSSNQQYYSQQQQQQPQQSHAPQYSSPSQQPGKLQFGVGRSPIFESSTSQPISQQPQPPAQPSFKFGTGATSSFRPANDPPVSKPATQAAPIATPIAPPKVHREVVGNTVSLTPKVDQQKETKAKVMAYSTGTKKHEFVEDNGQFKGSYASAASHNVKPRVSLERPGKFRTPANAPAGTTPANFSFDRNLEQAQSNLSEAQQAVLKEIGGGVFYEKSSFFDNISSDARDGKSEDSHYRNERNLNIETFGVSGPPRHGGYRGRGRGRGGHGGRGGYRGGRGRDH